MILKSLTNGKVTGTGTLIMSQTMSQGIFGGVLISTDGTNAVTVTLTDGSGQKIFEVSTTIPGFVIAPIHSLSNTLAYAITGTGGAAQFYEWIN